MMGKKRQEGYHDEKGGESVMRTKKGQKGNGIGDSRATAQ